MAKALRKLVSKQKKRFSEDGFDLDLSYITPQLIAMGYPTEGKESAYRNPYRQVYAFLEKRHKDNYKVYNLCSEKNRQYDAAKFNDRVACFPFEDHHPPPFQLIEAFCRDLHAYLAESEAHVAAIHCKAGKGRTGTMIICYLLYAHYYSDPDHAKRYYAAMRTYNRKGLTIPSQIRYVDYFFRALDMNGGKAPFDTPPTLALTGMRFSPPPYIDRLDTLRFVVYCDRALVYEHEKAPKVAPTKDISAARKESMSQIAGGDAASQKKPKVMECASCNKSFSSKANEWVICSLCGGDTCTECTHNDAVPALGERGKHRLVCGACTKDPSRHVITADKATVVAMNTVTETYDGKISETSIFFKLDAPVAIRGDVRLAVLHKGNTKPLFHCWINTNFHSTFPVILQKRQIDGADKDPKNKKYPADFHWVLDMRPAEAGEAVSAKKPSTPDVDASMTASGMHRAQDGIFSLNAKSTTGKAFSPTVAAELLQSAVVLLKKHSVDKNVFSIDSAASVASDLDYAALLARLGRLDAVELGASSEAARLAFWLNAFHLLLLVSFVECYPYTPRDRSKNHVAAHFHICGQHLALRDIEFGILRSALQTDAELSKLPKHVAAAVPAKAAPHPQWALNVPHTGFAISYCCSGTPRLRVYNEATLQEDIKANITHFLTSKSNKSAYLDWFFTPAELTEAFQIAGVAGDVAAMRFKDEVMLDEILLDVEMADAPEGDGFHTRSNAHAIPADKGKDE